MYFCMYWVVDINVSCFSFQTVICSPKKSRDFYYDLDPWFSVRSRDQKHRYHLEACQKCKSSGHSLYLLNQKLWRRGWAKHSGVYLISPPSPPVIWSAHPWCENHGSSLAISSEVQRLMLASFGGQLETQNFQPQPDLFIQNPHISLVICKQVLKIYWS